MTGRRSRESVAEQGSAHALAELPTDWSKILAEAETVVLPAMTPAFMRNYQKAADSRMAASTRNSVEVKGHAITAMIPVATSAAFAEATAQVMPTLQPPYKTAMLRALPPEQAHRKRERANRKQLIIDLYQIQVVRMTDFAVWLAGRKRISVRDEWRSHLSGMKGSRLPRKAQALAVFGFLLAAIRYRLQDAADLAWRPVDAVLSSRFLSGLFVIGPVFVVLVAIVRRDGRFGLVADIQDYGTLGALLWGIIRGGRRWRQIKLPEPEPRRTKE